MLDLAERQAKDAAIVDFALALEKDAQWESGPQTGLMARDLALGAASGGRMTAHHVKVAPGSGPVRFEGHDAGSDFDLVYVLGGSAKLIEPDGAEHLLRPGDCAHQARLLRANRLILEPGCTLMDMGMGRVAGDTPAGRPFVSREGPEAYETGAGPRRFFAYRDLGVAASTRRRIHIHIVKAVERPQGGTGWHYHTMSQLFMIFTGWADLAVEGHGVTRMAGGDAMCIGSGTRHDVPDFSADYSLLEVCIPADYDTVATAPG